MKNKTAAVVAAIVLILLAASLFISLKFNETNIALQQELLLKSQISLKVADKEIMIGLNDIVSAEENFRAVLDTSVSSAKYHDYTGAQLKNILINKNINIENYDTVLLSGADGFSAAYAAEEVIKDNNVYIAYKEDGNLLKSMDSGGSGPFLSIIVQDSFSNRRCKYLTKIEVK